MATEIAFFVVDEDGEDVPVGSVMIGDGKIEADNEDLKELAGTFGGSTEEIIQALSSWSNGYLRSEKVG